MVPSFKAKGVEESTLELNSEAWLNMESQLSFFFNALSLLLEFNQYRCEDQSRSSVLFRFFIKAKLTFLVFNGFWNHEMGIRGLAVQTFLPVAKLQQRSWLKKQSKASALFSLYKCRQWAINKSQGLCFHNGFHGARAHHFPKNTAQLCFHNLVLVLVLVLV